MERIKTDGILKTIGAIGLFLIGVSTFYYFVIFLPKQSVSTQNKAETDSRLSVLERELSKTKQDFESIKNKEQKIIEKPAYIQPKQNNDLIIINYKLDIQDGKGLREFLSNTAYNSPSQMCPSIISEKTTRQHAYYSVLDNIVELKSKYGQYRNSISYIDNNLVSLDATIQIIKDKCASLGYFF